MAKTLKATVDLTDEEKTALVQHVFQVLREMAESSNGNVTYDMTLPDGWVYSLSVKHPKKSKAK